MRTPREDRPNANEGRAAVARVGAACGLAALGAALFAGAMALVHALVPGAGTIVTYAAAGALTGGAMQAGREAVGAVGRRRAAPQGKGVRVSGATAGPPPPPPPAAGG